MRIFHGLQRFSEDMDFSLLTQDDKFDFREYFPTIVDAFAMVGREVEIKKKDKKNFGKVESVDDVNKEEFELYCLNPSIHRRSIVKEQCHNIDQEFKVKMPEVKVLY